GAIVVPAESADEALFLFERVRPHVVLTDIAMPVHDGYWLLRHLRAQEPTGRPPTPVVAMTAFSRPDLGSRARRGDFVRGDFDGWLMKPLDLDEMAALLESVARRRMAA